MRKENIIVVLVSVLATLLTLAPVAYMAFRSLPPKMAVVDLQALIEEDQKRIYDVIAMKESTITDEQRLVVERMTIDFAKKLSVTVDGLGAECKCLVINKAALLSGNPTDLTDAIRERMKR